ncbi:ARM repeat-containing protein [Haematococcus lacustris]
MSHSHSRSSGMDRMEHMERMGGSGGGEHGRDEAASFKYQTLEEVAGQVLAVAQDQNGCRFLQRKFDEGGPAAVALVLEEVLECVVELMVDPFGNYLVQKLLDRCSEQQRLEVLRRVAQRGELASVALNTHGTRAVQKLIETLSSREQRQIVVEALRGAGVVSLIKDLNGNHVVQRCLQRLGPEDAQFIYDAASAHCVEIATHRHGCCVLQRCIDFATSAQKKELIERVAENAFVLSQDAFGNYVVQYVLELGQSEASQAVIAQLSGHFAELSMQKFSSNVVERCLKLGGVLAYLLWQDAEREAIVRELVDSPLLPRLLQDGDALNITHRGAHLALTEAIRPYLASLRGTPHGKRILQRISAK